LAVRGDGAAANALQPGATVITKLAVPLEAAGGRLAGRITLSLRRGHLPDHELALSDLLPDLFELLLMAFLLSDLLWSRQVLVPRIALPVDTRYTGGGPDRGQRKWINQDIA